MLIADKWKEYKLLDTGGGEKLEDWGGILTVRPDPQIIWDKTSPKLWADCHMRYHRSKTGGGSWERLKEVPQRWTIHYGRLSFIIRPTDFKHMGLFPEQAANWDWMDEKISKSKRQVRLLNLFAYTGGATAAAAKAGAVVTHVDAAKGMNQWAKENAAASGINEKNLRFITEDVLKFVNRELRRQSKYDAIVMDPPSYGRGAGGEVWKIEDRLYELVKLCRDLLSDTPLFFLINSYTTGLSPTVLRNTLTLAFSRDAGISCGEIGIPSKNGIILPCGVYGRLEM